ncbi:MAG: 3'-5' exonuclease, partial [bacterium]
ITITPLKTGNQKRLVNGYSYKLSSTKSFNDIIAFLKEGGMNPYEKLRDENGDIVRNDRGDATFMYRDNFFSVKLNEQFFISTRSRLFKGFEEYKDVHKLTFDIETTGLRYEISRIFSIGVRDNKGFETILEVDKENDDESEKKLIQDFFNVIQYVKPAVISGYNSEVFDFEFILGRAKILKMDMSKFPTSLNPKISLRRKPNTSVKYGNTADKYTATEMWGISVIDILHAVKKTIAVNSDLKNSKLKYIAEYEKVAKPNRTHIDGSDNGIGSMYSLNEMYVINEMNQYEKIPDEYQETARKLYKLQANKSKFTEEQYKKYRNAYFKQNLELKDWLKKNAVPNGMTKFISGKNIVRQYLLDDLWETEQIDELYNQSSFMLAKIVPTTYQRVCTMGTAAIWNLLMTAWSYENDVAIPESDGKEKFSGGLARCFKTGYTKRVVKIDYASLYPMIQLTHDVFPMFDITGVLKKMLLYLTTTRNIYKKLASSSSLNEEEVILLKEIDHEAYNNYINGTLTKESRAFYKVKQLPIKILNNSLFGALGSDISFNWSDNISAARITTTGRLELRHAIAWFNDFGCEPLLAVTDGVNFGVPDKTTIKVNDDGVFHDCDEDVIENMWTYKGLTGINALIEKFNDDEMTPPFMAVDNDGEFKSCLNLSRINYGLLLEEKDKETGKIKEKIKLTGNTIKSKIMPEYIEEFIDKALSLILNGKGKEFVEYYYDYVDDIRYMQIPLKKIANKSKVKMTLKNYLNRGTDKNGRRKAMQAHMELLIQERERIAEELFQEHMHEFNIPENKELTIDDKMKLVANYMPQEPELDSVVYYVNTGYRKSHGDSKIIKDKTTGEERFCSKMISASDLNDNPNMTGEYNYEKYLDAFNKRVKALLVGFEPDVAKRMLVKIDKNGDLKKEMFTSEELELKNFQADTVDESIHLEKLEVDFWNKTGYDPRKIWNGFKTYDDPEYQIHYGIYEHALNHLNNIMKKNGKREIKSINDDYKVNDYVLIKNQSKYSVGLYNGIYFQIVRDDVDIPKSDIEIELEKNQQEIENKTNELKTSELTMKDDVELDEKEILMKKAFEVFKKQNGIPEKYDMDTVFNNIPNSKDAFDDFVDELMGSNEENNNDEDYMTVDDYY